MTLRKKTLAIVSLTIVISILLLYNASRIIVSGSFTKLEEQYTHQHVERVRDKLLNEYPIESCR
jgi:sensor domain CHASE-containing protein